MGILDRDSRFTDTVVTAEGRRQLARTGGLAIAYASLSDSGTVYEESEGYDAGAGIVLEAGSAPSDTVVVESNEGGVLSPFKLPGLSYYGGAAYGPGGEEVDIDEAAVQALSRASSQSWTDMSLLADYPPWGESGGFQLYPSASSLAAPAGQPVSVEDAPSLYEDNDLASLGNFDFLPPTDSRGQPLAAYRLPGEKRPDLTTAQYLQAVKKSPRASFYLDSSREDADLQMQVFQASPAGGFTQLVTRVYSESPRVVAVGKLYRDTSGSDTFARIFAVTFSD